LQPNAQLKRQREAAVLLPPSGTSVKAADNLRRVAWDVLLQARLVSGDLPQSSDEPTKAKRKSPGATIMTTKEKQREAKPISPEARPAHRHCDYATRVQAHLAKHAGALALIQKPSPRS